MKTYLSCVWAILVIAQNLPAQEAASPASAMRLTWGEADHASGIYYVKGEAKLTVVAENISMTPVTLGGQIAFVRRNPPVVVRDKPAPDVATGQGGGAKAMPEFETISVTPIAAVMLQGGVRAKIPLALTFSAAGTYELHWLAGDGEAKREVGIENAAGVTLQSIFAPRTAGGDAAAESPWITTLPRSAVRAPGFLTDYLRQTTVRRFLIDERFAFDATRNVGLGLGASMGADISAAQVDALLTEAAKVRAGIILRVTIPMDRETGGVPDPRMLAAFKEYLTDAIRRARGQLVGMVMRIDAPSESAANDNTRAAFRAFYLAGYEAAKRADKNIIMLGAGSAQETADLLGPELRVYMDALAITDAAGQPETARRMGGERKLPLWLLPPVLPDPWALVPAAAGLAEGAAIVPVPPPEIDNGVAAHLLGGTVLVQRIRPQSGGGQPDVVANQLPFVSVFQGDGYALAAIAGFSAGTSIDGLFPAVARTRTLVEPLKEDRKPPYSNLEISDDARTMRVVDSAGAPVECRIGDTVYIPAGDSMMYVLQGGLAEELAGSLRPAATNRLPAFEITASMTNADARSISLTLHNITTTEISGRVQIILSSPDAVEGGWAGKVTVLADQEFMAISPGKTRELPLDIAADRELPRGGTVVVQVTTNGVKGVIQRTAIMLQPRQSFR